MPGQFERDVLRLVVDVLGGATEATPPWLKRPGRAECGSHWRTVCDIYDDLTKDCALEQGLRETMPPREWRRVDCVLNIGDSTSRIIEVDETQHFNPYRAATLRLYPADARIGFDAKAWIARSESKTSLEGGGFGKRKPPLFDMEWGRHRQRAFRDALADILPPDHGFLPTLRIAFFEVAGWLHSDNARTKMKELLDRKCN